MAFTPINQLFCLCFSLIEIANRFIDRTTGKRIGKAVTITIISNAPVGLILWDKGVSEGQVNLTLNYIMRTEMKASSECLYPTDVFLISCGMGCKRISVLSSSTFATSTYFSAKQGDNSCIAPVATIAYPHLLPTK